MQDSSLAAKLMIQEFFKRYPVEAANLLNTFPAEDILNYLYAEPISDAANLFGRLNPEVAAGLAVRMEDNFFAQLFALIDPSLAARLLSRLKKDVVESRLVHLPTALAKELRELMDFPMGTAGYLMDPRIPMFHPDDTIEKVLDRIRNIHNRRVVNIHIIDDDGNLAGMVPLQDVAVSLPHEKLKSLILKHPISIQAMSPREDVVQLLEENKLISLPVVDMDGKLLGVIRYDALVNAAKLDAIDGVQAMFGAGRDERALSKAAFAIRKRLPWLEINLATAFLASAVVGLFEETIARITILAVFLPVVAGQSGNTGSQALAVTMRGLALREIRGRHWFRVARKELLVGFVNGCAVALTTSMVVFFWADSFGLAIIIAVAMIVSMTIAGFAGAIIPIVLKALGQDPAQSSSIVLTTVTDVVGFMSFLGLATLLANVLNIS